MTWDPLIDWAAIERFFAERFGDASLFDHLVSDLVLTRPSTGCNVVSDS